MSQKATESSRLDLRGIRTLRTADATRALLQGALARDLKVSIDCEGVTELDLSLIQLLVAAQASARLAGANLSLTSPPQGLLLETLIRAGFEPKRAEDDADGGFWFEGMAQ